MATIIRYCPVCGEPVIAQSAKRKNKIYCSTECCHRASDRRRRGLPISDKENGYAPKPKPKPKKTARELMLERLTVRDAEYAAAFPDCVSGEWRGRTITGSKAGTFRQEGLKASDLPNVFKKAERY